jgi:heat shock protein HslJ
MGVLTRLPRDLRGQLRAADPAASGTPPTSRPDFDALLRRATTADDQPGEMPRDGSIDSLPRNDFDTAVHNPRRSQSTFVVLSAAVMVVAVAIGVTLLSRSSQLRQHVGSSSGSEQALYGVSWTDTASHATVVFRPGRAHTSDGCSGRTQSLLVYGHHLRLGKQLGQAYGCIPVVGPPPGTPGYAAFHREQQAVNHFYRVLASSPTWSITNDTLTLTGPDDTSIRLTTKRSAPLSLSGSRWVLQDVTTLDRSGVSGALVGPSLTFDGHSRFRASDSCDDLLGTAKFTTTSVAFHTVSKTHHKCRKSYRTSMIATIDTLLNSTVTYRVEDNSLRLRKPGTEGRLLYLPASQR